MMRYHLTIGKTAYDVDVLENSAGALEVTVNNRTYAVAWQRETDLTGQTARPAPVRQTPSPVADPAPARHRAAPGGRALTAPIPGLILEVKVKEGDRVQAGQTVATMEAMKMENNLTAHIAGTVEKILVQKGSEVATGDVLMLIAA